MHLGGGHGSCPETVAVTGRGDSTRGASAMRAAWTGFVLALIGLAVSVYLTIEHYSANTSLACPATATLNCLKVTTSRWSVIAGVPVAVLGLGFFLVMTALTLPVRRTDPWHAVRVALAGAGSVMVVYLVYIELFRVDAICLWCTAVHVLTIALLAAVLWRREVRAER